MAVATEACINLTSSAAKVSVNVTDSECYIVRNATIAQSGSFIFSYTAPGQKNFSYYNNTVCVNGKLNRVCYNYTSGQSWLQGERAFTLPSQKTFSVKVNTNFTRGTYYIYNSSRGVGTISTWLNISGGSITIDFRNGIYIHRDSNLYGRGILVYAQNKVTVKNLDMSYCYQNIY